MSGIEHVHFRLRHVLAITFRFAGIEREIVLAPDDEKLRLCLLHPRLPLRIGVDVRPVIVEEIALNLRLPRRVQECVFVRPKVRIVERNVRIVPDMTRLCRLQRKQISAKRRLVRRAIFPKLAARLPVRAQAFVVRHSILHDERFHPLRMRQCHSKTDRHAIVLHVKRVTREPQRFREMIHDLCDMVERVRNFFGSGQSL